MPRYIVLLQDGDGMVRANVRRHYVNHADTAAHAMEQAIGAERDAKGVWRFRTPADVVRVVAVKIDEWVAVDLDRHRPTAATTSDEWERDVLA